MMLFKNIKDFKEFVKKEWNFPDLIMIKNINNKYKNVIFTMDFYDLEGIYIYYGNKKNSLGLQIKTENRYINKHGFVEINLLYDYLLREDIFYYE